MKKLARRFYSAPLSILALLGATSTEAVPLFTDGDFSTGWDYSFLAVDNPNQPGTGPGTSTGTITRIETGGNPGAHLRHDHKIVWGDRLYTVAINTNAVYDPGASGTVDTIDIVFDGLSEDNGIASGWAVIEQGGELFLEYAADTGRSFWKTIVELGMTATVFSMLDGNGLDANRNPDFSSSGAPLTFGYALRNGISGGAPGATLNATHRVDNWSVRVNPAPAPATIALLGLGIVGIASLRTKK